MRRAKALNDPANKMATAYILALKKADASMTMKAITSELNKSGFKTSRGNNFSEMAAARLYKRSNV